jgi:hypothetical protein
MLAFALISFLCAFLWATFPTAKKHRTSTRKLGKGQHTQLPPATVLVTDSASTATLTFSVPIVVNGNIPMNVSGGLTLVTQTVVSPTVVTQLYSGALTTKTWSIPANTPQIATMQGGGFAGASGTFS